MGRDEVGEWVWLEGGWVRERWGEEEERRAGRAKVEVPRTSP